MFNFISYLLLLKCEHFLVIIFAMNIYKSLQYLRFILIIKMMIMKEIRYTDDFLHHAQVSIAISSQISFLNVF